MEVNTISQPALTTKPVKVDADIVKPTLAAEVQDGKDAIQKPSVSVQQNVVAKVDSVVLESMNKQLELAGTGLAFSVDEATSSSIIKVVEKETGEVVKQFPSEDSLKIMKNIQAYLMDINNQQHGNVKKEELTGILFNEII